MAVSLDAAADIMRQAMRDAIRKSSAWYLVQGGLMVLAGLFALVYPVTSSGTIQFFLGWLLILSGIVHGISLLGARKLPLFWLQLISVALFLIVGSLVLRDPGGSLMMFSLLLIVLFMVEGISKVVLALTIRPFPEWGWVLGSGMVGIVLALYLWASIPLSAPWALGVLLGILLVSEGTAIGYLAWRVRNG